MPTTQNKLTPLLVVIAAVIVGYVMWAKFTTPSPTATGGTSVAARTGHEGGDEQDGQGEGAEGGCAHAPQARSEARVTSDVRY